MYEPLNLNAFQLLCHQPANSGFIAHLNVKSSLLLIAIKELWFEEKETSEQDCWSGPQEPSAKQLTSSEIFPDSQFFTDLVSSLVTTMKNKPVWFNTFYFKTVWSHKKGKDLIFPSSRVCTLDINKKAW